MLAIVLPEYLAVCLCFHWYEYVYPHVSAGIALQLDLWGTLMRGKLLFLAIGLSLCCAAPAGAAAPSLSIDVLSNRADLVSAGDALVRVTIPAGVSAAKVRVYDDGRDVTSAFGCGRTAASTDWSTACRSART